MESVWSSCAHVPELRYQCYHSSGVVPQLLAQRVWTSQALTDHRGHTVSMHVCVDVCIVGGPGKQAHWFSPRSTIEWLDTCLSTAFQVICQANKKAKSKKNLQGDLAGAPSPVDHFQTNCVSREKAVPLARRQWLLARMWCWIGSPCRLFEVPQPGEAPGRAPAILIRFSSYLKKPESSPRHFKSQSDGETSGPHLFHVTTWFSSKSL